MQADGPTLNYIAYFEAKKLEQNLVEFVPIEQLARATSGFSVEELSKSLHEMDPGIKPE
jgi:hypothetical protein